MTYDIVYARNLCNASTGEALTAPSVEYEGFVKRLSGERVFVQFTRNFHETFGQEVLADVRFSYQRRPFRLLHQAVDLVDLNRVCPSETSVPSEAVRAAAQRRHASAESGINSFDPSLNDVQRSAVKSAFALANGTSPFLVFGPFGSGKTRVCSAILRLFAANPAATILVCCPSNSAADVYINFLARSCESLSLSPKAILRIYAAYRRRESVPPHVLPFCHISADGHFECPPLSVVTAARIVVTTFITAATLVGMGVPKDHFKVILLDEAAQANEVEALIPMCLAGPSSQVILAGDAKQLGGTVLSAESRRFGMGSSIMERLSSLPIYSSLSAILCAHLTANFRCHSAILDCASQVFYSGLLHACGDVSSMSLSQWRRLHNAAYPVCCIHVEGQDQLAPDSPSFYNMYEASTIAALVSELVEDTGCAQGEIAVLAPFSKQIETIRLLLRSRKLSGVKVSPLWFFKYILLPSNVICV
jgi:helicase MOV-10